MQAVLKMLPWLIKYIYLIWYEMKWYAMCTELFYLAQFPYTWCFVALWEMPLFNSHLYTVGLKNSRQQCRNTDIYEMMITHFQCIWKSGPKSSNSHGMCCTSQDAIWVTGGSQVHCTSMIMISKNALELPFVCFGDY